MAAAALAAVGLTGPANVQGFVADDGAATVVEINPRFSGGLPLTLAAGADVVATLPGREIRGGLRSAARSGWSTRPGVPACAAASAPRCTRE